MGLHSSFKQGDQLAATRSILTRNERIKWMMSQGSWQENNKVYGLPKIKVIKLKAAKKEKAKAEAGTETKPAAATTAAAEKK